MSCEKAGNHLFSVIGRRSRRAGWRVAVLWLAGGAAAMAVARAESESVLHTFATPRKGSVPGGLLRTASGAIFGTAYGGGAHGLGVVFERTAKGRLKLLYSFKGGTDGANANAGLARDSSGNLYGTTYAGGAFGWGIVFKVTRSGKETVLYNFTGGADGGHPAFGVIRDPAGNLYGGTWQGGAGGGVIYMLSPAGAQTTLHTFSNGSDGSVPFGTLVRDSSGNLYGVTAFGGNVWGVVFEIEASGAFKVLYTFTGGEDGGVPSSSLIRDSAGNLYGGTQLGGANGCGVVFQVSPSAQETVLNSFNGGDYGCLPDTLVEDSAGNLYGTTTSGGADNAGVIFELPAHGIQQVLYTFLGGATGLSNPSSLTIDAKGNLYGATDKGGATRQGVIFEFTTSGELNTLYAFPSPADGAYPGTSQNVIRDSSGNLYGTTGGGGSAGWGTVYEVQPDGNESILHTFTGGEDGGSPQSGLARDAQGNLYGTTTYGAANYGTVFKLSPTGQFTTLHTFTGGSGGWLAAPGVSLDAQGNLYGTALFGGVYNSGIVYKIDIFNQYSVLYSFTGGADGADPNGGVVPDGAGNLYGTTQTGGQYNLGAIYKLNSSGQQTVLYSFTGGTDQAYPWAGVVLDAQGTLYATSLGLATGQVGAVYSLSQDGTFTTLHTFAGAPDGCNPYSGVTLDAAGNVYGTTQSCGSAGYGVVYEISLDGQETILHNFAGAPDGASPLAGVTLDSAGNVYGTTSEGGAKNTGVVYEITP